MGSDSREKEKFCMSYWLYEPSFENDKKLECIEKLDSVLSIVKSTWNENMITGGSNIGLLASTEIQKRYIEVFETYDLNNNI